MNQNDINEFIAAFDLDENGYTRHTTLDEPLVGFSTVIECSESLKNKLSIEAGKNYVTLMYVSIDREVADSDATKKEVTIEASFVLELEDGFNYKYEFIKSKKFMPINLITNKGEYFYNIENRKFFAEDGQEIDAIDCLKEVYSKHMMPSEYFRGFILRAKIKYNRMAAGLYSLLSEFFSKFYYLLFREKKEYEHPDYTRMRTRLGIAEMEEPEEPVRAEKFDFLGVKNLDPDVILFFCIVHLVLYVVYQLLGLYIEIVRILFYNTFLTVCYATTVLLLMMLGKHFLLKEFLQFLIQKTGMTSDAISYSKPNL